MINHARTLLLNTPAQNHQLQDPGYEYIPEAFRALTLPATLNTLHTILFGKQPDPYFLNLRGRELLTYIHQTELAEYIYKLDPRVTYWPNTATPFFENSKPVLTVTQFAGAPRRLNFGGTFSASATQGRAARQYIVKLSNDPTTTISIKELHTTAPVTATVLSDPEKIQTIPLPATQLQFSVDLTGSTTLYKLLTELADIIVAEEYDPTSLPEAALLAEPSMLIDDDPLASTAQWLVTARANPKPAITTLFPVLELLGEPLFLDLFGVAPVEPYATFKNLWFDHPMAAYRLAGLVLAFIYRAEELRKVNDG